MTRKNCERTIKRHRTKDKRLYTLEVFLISGPTTYEFARKNPVVSRTIQIRGDQTLEDLHYAIFGVFDRYDDHMYEFQFGGSGPMDPGARRYVLPMAMQEDSFPDDDQLGDATRTKIGSLGLQVDEAFGYWFDFGDDWWHQINVVAIEEKALGWYPKADKRVGQSPLQYEQVTDDE
jgi:hypothetical protein